MLYAKITLLNQTIIECINASDEYTIIKAFTESGLSLLDADFGYVWFNSYQSSDFEMVYKSPTTPYEPAHPRKAGRNSTAIKNRTPNYVIETSEENDTQAVGKYLKSFVIIPIFYREKVYGTIVFCFIHNEIFPKEKKILCECIGTSLAQAITIHRLLAIEKERSKSQFIAEATHELRTPLAIIKGNVDLALQAKKNPAQITRTFNAINDEVKHMSELVSDMAFLVKSEGSFQKKISSHDVRLDDLIHQTIERCETLARKKSISLEIGRLPAVTIQGDQTYLEKMFTNLIKNAIVYGNKKGYVKIVGVKKKDFVCIHITDNGIGISKEDMPNIFNRFYRSQEAREKNLDGTGLGLAIVKWVAETHGGNITATSVLGSGSVFSVCLPYTENLTQL